MTHSTLMGFRARVWGWVLPALGVLFALSCGKTTDSGPADTACVAPTTACGGACVDIATDAAHCGSCGRACPAGDACVEGACTSTGCPAGQSLCEEVCTSLETNRLSCGTCGTACAPGELCEGGSCACPETLCGGECVNTDSTDAHCGACDSPCAPDELCEAGRCEPRCSGALSYCADGCRDVSTDVTACGACDSPCAENEVCQAGRCVCPSEGDIQACSAECVDVSLHADHCGACGNACSTGTHCVGGQCTACVGDFFFCPSEGGDPLATCLAQAAGVEASALEGGASASGGPDLACQCRSCLVELQDCLGDTQCVATWQCAVANACTEACWGSMGVCALPTDTTGCFKWCPPSTGSTQTAARAEALLRCTIDNGCGI